MLSQLLQMTILLSQSVNVDEKSEVFQEHEDIFQINVSYVKLPTDTCRANTYPHCHSWGSCSKTCGGGRRSRICESCYLYQDKRFYEDCNTNCLHGHRYSSGKCRCPSWRAGECCEGKNLSPHIYSELRLRLSGLRRISRQYKCTRCIDPYYPAGYGNGCRECPEINRCVKRHCTAPSNTKCIECKYNNEFFQKTTGGKKCQSKPLPPKVFQYIFDHIVPSFLWQKDFNGGLEQSFVIQTSVVGTERWTNHTSIHEKDRQYRINETFYLANVTGLQPGVYNARIIANNIEGDSESVDLEQTFEIQREVPCPAETTEHLNYGTFTWPVTQPGASSYLQCPYQLYNNGTVKNASRNCERQNDYSGRWKQPLVSSCPHSDETSRELQNLAESDINEGNIEEVSSSLGKLTSYWKDFTSAQITLSVDIIYRISNLSRASPSSVSTTLDTVNNMLFIKFDVLQEAEVESKSLNKLVKGIQMLFEAASVEGGDFQTVKENIAGIATTINASSFKGLTMSYRNPGTKTLTNTKITYSKEDDETAEEDRSGIVLPRTMFDTLRQERRKSVEKITILVFRDAKLFSSITQTSETKLIEGDNGNMISAERKINSNIIGASVPATPVKDLQIPVVVTLFHLYTGKNVSCVYWDVDLSTWSADGCNVKKTTDDYTVCHCNHLTNFALLMDVYNTGASSLALSVISYVGCGLSLIGVLLTLITYLKFRKLRRGNPSKILMNLCLSIGLVDVVFLVGVQEYSGNSDSGCKIAAVLLHYCLLSSMCWMAVEAFYMYLSLVKVFDTHVAHFQLKSSLFGWCTPLLVVAITLGINKSENYGLQPGGICWLDRIPFYAAFLAPVCLLLLVNTMTYLLVIYRIVNRGTTNMTKSDKSTTIVRLRGAVSVLVLLGLTWVFGVLAFDGIGEVFHYVFALLNSLQGLFIFVFYCVLRKEAQQCWRQALPCLKSPYEKNTSSNTRNKCDTSVVDSSKTTTFNSVSKEGTGKTSNYVEDKVVINTGNYFLAYF